MSDTDTKTEPCLTVYYDGACPLCTVEIKHYAALDGAEAIRFVDAADPAQDLGTDLSQDQAMARFHVRDADGNLRSGAAGFAAIWAQLPKWRWAAQLARVPGVLWLLERAYRGFLPIRPYLSRAVGRMQARRSRVSDRSAS